MPISYPLLLITFFQNYTGYMIMPHDNKFQEIIIINVLELIMVKKCCNTLVMLHWVAFLIILKCYHYICFLSSKVATACWVLTFCDTYAM